MATEMKIFLKIAVFLLSVLVSTGFAKPLKVLIVNTNTAVPRYEKNASAFKNKLQENNYALLEFNLEGRADPETDLQQMLQQENPDIIYCIGTKAYSLSQKQVKNEILLFSAAINWRRLSLSDSAYGISNELSPEQEMTFVRFFFPGIKKIGVLYSQEFNQEYLETVKNEAASLNMEIVAQQISNTSELDDALTELLPKIDLFWLISDPVVLENKEASLHLLQIAKQQHKPVYAYSDTYIKYGAVLSVSADGATFGKQAANLVMSLQHSKLTGSHVQPPAGTNISLNMCVVDELKMNLNKEALSSVDQLVKCPTP
jgi:putative tryptophan/tyrosine transport system substrate-binding protein